MRRLTELLSFGLLLALFAAGASLIAFTDNVYWVDIIFDDGYYYLGIARNIIAHGLSSFSPPIVTNGYQPLWLVLLVASASIFGLGNTAMALQLFTLSLLFSIAFFLMSRSIFGRGWPAAFNILLFPAVYLTGMETTMLPVLVLWFLFTRNDIARGVAGALVFLTRLDALGLLLSRDLYNVAINRRFNLRHWRIIAPVIVGYLALNFHVFGTPIPVSGLAKSVGNRFMENILPAMLYGKALAPAALSIAGLMLLRKFTTGTPSLKYREMIGSSIGAAIACSIYYSSFSGWTLWGWYYWPVALVYFFSLQELCDIVRDIFFSNDTDAAAPAGRRKWSPASSWLLIGIGHLLVPGRIPAIANTLAGYAGSVLESVQARPARESYGRENLKLLGQLGKLGIANGAFFAMGDRAGSFGFFLPVSYRFFHTEGLVGNLEYIKALQRDAGAEFVNGLGITHFVADRQVYLEAGDLIGLAEPIQGFSARTGPYLLCFNKQGIVSDTSYGGGRARRLVINAHAQSPCSMEMREQFNVLRSKYGGLRSYTLPAEHSAGPYKWVLKLR